MNYKIKKIYLENFKLITTKGILLSDFENSDFIVLDGPNGFGKTTIFDALEIALTGKIHRISENQIVPGNQGAEDIVYLNNQLASMKIVIEFVSETDSKIIYVHGKSGETLGRTAKRVNNSDYFERYEIENFDDYKKPISDLTSINQTTIDEWFNFSHRFYNLYHYVQQEESTFFLKLKENERMDKLGRLFDTDKEEIEEEKIKDLHNKLNLQIKILSDTKDNNLKEIENIQQAILEDVGLSIEYNNVFEFLNYPPEWNNEILSGLNVINTDGFTKRDAYKNEIISIIASVQEFKNDYPNFLKYNRNIEIERRIQNTNNLEIVLLIYELSEDLFYDFTENLQEIKLKFNQQERILNFQNLLKKDKLLKKIEDIEFEEYLNDLKYKNSEIFFEKVKTIITLKSKEDNISEIVRDFSETREDIVTLFKKIHDEDKEINFDESECPLCGYDWPDGYMQLLEQIDLKESKLNKIKSITSLEIENEYEIFYDNFIKDLNILIENYLENSENLIDRDYFYKINLDSTKESEILDFLNWLKDKAIDISDISYKEMDKFPTDLEARTENLIAKLIAKKEIVSEDFDLNRFTLFFNGFLENNEKNIDNISEEKLRNKISYIDQQYFRGNSLRISELLTQNDFIENEQLSKLKQITGKTQTILDIYSKEIKDHRRQIAKNIELPFFIISSKILQNFEYGSGLFIKWNQSNNTENLKFTLGSKTSHDALYSMSSGQLSALVISFTLAMNKVFDKSNFGTLLIDDPTQTMDEINMSSLVELLRNEFYDKQIILSTHEDEVSYFMRFKFHEFNQKTTSINMKDKQFAEFQTEI